MPKKNIKEIKRTLGISNKEIAGMFGYANANSYATSSAYKRIESGLVEFYEVVVSNIKTKEVDNG
ncbi:hypothetical protein [Peijinzhouia sedimentorum]